MTFSSFLTCNLPLFRRQSFLNKKENVLTGAWLLSCLEATKLAPCLFLMRDAIVVWREASWLLKRERGAKSNFFVLGKWVRILMDIESVSYWKCSVLPVELLHMTVAGEEVSTDPITALLTAVFVLRIWLCCALQSTWCAFCIDSSQPWDIIGMSTRWRILHHSAVKVRLNN